jgi:hypothetical protein
VLRALVRQLAPHGRTFLALAVALWLVVWYFNGWLDKPLSQVRLNWTECAEVFGTTYCGDELEQLRDRLAR